MTVLSPQLAHSSATTGSPALLPPGRLEGRVEGQEVRLLAPLEPESIPATSSANPARRPPGTGPLEGAFMASPWNSVASTMIRALSFPGPPVHQAVLSPPPPRRGRGVRRLPPSPAGPSRRALPSSSAAARRVGPGEAKSSHCSRAKERRAPSAASRRSRRPRSTSREVRAGRVHGVNHSFFKDGRAFWGRGYGERVSRRKIGRGLMNTR
jgi:hypothetical protein